jgi:hypothetical protein
MVYEALMRKYGMLPVLGTRHCSGAELIAFVLALWAAGCRMPVYREFMLVIFVPRQNRRLRGVSQLFPPGQVELVYFPNPDRHVVGLTRDSLFWSWMRTSGRMCSRMCTTAIPETLHGFVMVPFAPLSCPCSGPLIRFVLRSEP